MHAPLTIRGREVGCLYSGLTSAEVRGENTPEKKFASSGDRTHNHQVTEPPGLGSEEEKERILQA